MTVHDFIVIYNETFKYIESQYGADALKSLWSDISEKWCTHLKELVEEKGLQGMYEYWGGNEGTLGREKADHTIGIEGDTLKGVMNRCPSIGELMERGREIYKGKLTYCDHCLALYKPVVNRFGFEMKFDIDFNEDGVCAGRCTWISERSK